MTLRARLRANPQDDANDERTNTTMAHRKRIALVAHDDKKGDLLEWARYNRAFLIQHELHATGTTGALLEQELGVGIHKLYSGPLGGDQQIGAMIAQHELDLLVFFWDPLQMQPHDSDVRALLRIAVVWNIPVACNRATADFMLTSPLMTEPYEALVPDYARPSTGANQRQSERPTRPARRRVARTDAVSAGERPA
jgi:methylglyoxal synthase